MQLASVSERDGAKRAPAKHNMQTRTRSCRILALVCARWIPFILGVPREYMQMSVPATNVFSQAEEMDSRRRDDLLMTFALVWTSKSHPVSLHTRQLLKLSANGRMRWCQKYVSVMHTSRMLIG
jgi:hypothetical protein